MPDDPAFSSRTEHIKSLGIHWVKQNLFFRVRQLLQELFKSHALPRARTTSVADGRFVCQRPVASR
jgi:hypothetical protein